MDVELMQPSDRTQGLDADLDSFLDDVYRTYHHDFRSYARASLARRVAHAIAATHLAPDAYFERALRDPAFFAGLLRYMTVQVSELFRDPSYWRALRDRVVPHLSTYPSIRIWIPGCATGEEAYSMAILLYEEGLLDRSQIYATDIDPETINRAAAGVYELARLREFSRNYFSAGGRESLSEYYATAYGRAVFGPGLRDRILFSDHSLATDWAFAEVQLVSCRNVLIYFERPLKDRALSVISAALCARGFLGLGSKEALAFSRYADDYEAVDSRERIYRSKPATKAGDRA